MDSIIDIVATVIDMSHLLFLSGQRGCRGGGRCWVPGDGDEAGGRGGEGGLRLDEGVLPRPRPGARVGVRHARHEVS